MKGFELTQSEIQKLEAVHRACTHKRDAYKINALILLGTGWTLEETSEALLLNTETLSKYVDRYHSEGFQALLKTHYKGSQAKLNDEQLDKLLNELDNNIYLDTRSICDYVKREINIEYSISGMTDLLHRMNYVYKKPKLVPSNPDIHAQEDFVKMYTIFFEKKPENEAVFFVDALHPTHNTDAGYGWIRKGLDKEIPSNSGRARLNVHGAMNAETFETVAVIGEENVNSDSTIALFEQLEALYPLAVVIHVILDNAKYHYSKEVAEWVKKSRIKLIFLPPYSPELNLIERLWRIFKKYVMRNKYYKKYDEFKRACELFFKEQKKYLNEIQMIMGNGLQELL